MHRETRFQPDPIGYGTLARAGACRGSGENGGARAAAVCARIGSPSVTVALELGLGERHRCAGTRAACRRWRGERAFTEKSIGAPLSHQTCGSSWPAAHLLYGEWLRRDRRRVDAREQLRIAQEAFDEHRCGGVRPPRRAGVAGDRRTGAKRVGARSATNSRHRERRSPALLADGKTNREIAAQLFISPSTVEYRLRRRSQARCEDAHRSSRTACAARPGAADRFRRTGDFRDSSGEPHGQDGWADNLRKDGPDGYT